jgi:hypothetical protein
MMSGYRPLRGAEVSLGAKSFHAPFAMLDKALFAVVQHDLVKTQRAMGRANVNSTAEYLSFREEEIDAAILAA